MNANLASPGKYSEKKIVVSGNPRYGLASALNSCLTADFFSRSENEFDFSIEAKRKQFAELSLKYDVFVNCSALWRFQQILLLEEVHKMWLMHQHPGLIINIGSTADTPVKGTNWIYPIEKKALRAYSRNLSLAALGGHGSEPNKIRSTYISPGYLNTPSIERKHPGVKKLDVNYVASIVLWAIQQPDIVNISEICVDPIQVNQ